MKIMKLLENKTNTDDNDEDVMFQKVNEFQYLVSKMVGQERLE